MDAANPFVGLRPFAKPDVPTFFGRSSDVEAVTNLVVDAKPVVLYGRPGVGKTSLATAGVLPKLESLGYEIYGPARLLRGASVAPGEDALSRSLLKSLGAGETSYSLLTAYFRDLPPSTGRERADEPRRGGHGHTAQPGRLRWPSCSVLVLIDPPGRGAHTASSFRQASPASWSSATSRSSCELPRNGCPGSGARASSWPSCFGGGPPPSSIRPLSGTSSP